MPVSGPASVQWIGYCPPLNRDVSPQRSSARSSPIFATAEACPKVTGKSSQSPKNGTINLSESTEWQSEVESDGLRFIS